jgi:hypothetical protein
MILRQSNSILHGGLFALKGRYMANLFVPFEPTRHSVRYHNHGSNLGLTNVKKQYLQAMEDGTGGHNALADPYIENMQISRLANVHFGVQI